MSDADDMSRVFDFGAEGEGVSLADLANLPMDGVKEVRGGIMPKMSGRWKIKKMELTTRDTTKQGTKPVVAGQFECTQVHACLDDDVDGDSLVGRVHNQAWFIGVTDPPKPVEDIGRVKAFLADAGFAGSGSFQDVLAQAEGHEFDAPISHRKDKNDPDVVYAQFNNSKIKPVQVEEAAAE